jgi:hypothetical protein
MTESSGTTMQAERSQSEGAVRPRRPFVSRRVSPALFAAILVAFALPFGTISCEGPPVEFTGYELATWRVQQTTPPATTDDGKSLPVAVESQGSAMAFFMLASAVAGLALGLAGRRGAGFAVLAGLFGAVALWAKVLDIESGAEPKGGFELASFLFLLLAFWHGALAIRRTRLGSPGRPTGQPPSAARQPWAQSMVCLAILAVVAAGCSGGRAGSDPARVAELNDCPNCSVGDVLGWRGGSRSIVFTASTPDKTLRRYAVRTDGTGLHPDAKRVRRPARVWTRTHSRVAYVEKDETIVVRSRSGRRIASPTSSCFRDACYDEVFDSAPSWSPNGRWLLFTRTTWDVCGFCLPPGGSSFTALAIAHPDGTGFHWVMTGEGSDYDRSGSWSPDGHLIAFVRDDSLYVVEVDQRGTEGVPARPVVVP